jgi:hypothetical protein
MCCGFLQSHFAESGSGFRSFAVFCSPASLKVGVFLNHLLSMDMKQMRTLSNEGIQMGYYHQKLFGMDAALVDQIMFKFISFLFTFYK